MTGCSLGTVGASGLGMAKGCRLILVLEQLCSLGLLGEKDVEKGSNGSAASMAAQ